VVALIARTRIAESTSGKTTSEVEASEVEASAAVEEPRHEVSNVYMRGFDTAIELRNAGHVAVSDSTFGQDVRVAIETEGTKLTAERNHME
jgi:hypothetical protein